MHINKSVAKQICQLAKSTIAKSINQPTQQCAGQYFSSDTRNRKQEQLDMSRGVSKYQQK